MLYFVSFINVLSTKKAREHMKLLIEYTESGKYRDQAWEGYTYKGKGHREFVTPSFAAKMQDEGKVRIVLDEHGGVINDVPEG